MTQREDFEEFKLRGNSKYKPHDDSISDRHDWAVWQAAQAAQPVQPSQADTEALRKELEEVKTSLRLCVNRLRFVESREANV